jgi:outer membrane immunogenic protein
VKKFVAVATAIAAFGFVNAASAADMPTKAPMAPIAVPYNWSGCYLGANGGYGWQRSHSPDVVLSTGLVFPGTGTLNPSGGFGGGQIGCNFQTGSFVYGVETDFEGSGIRSSYGPTPFAVPAVLTISGSQSLVWFGTLRGRLGWTVADRVLLYVTGGLAYGKTKFNGFAFDAAANNVTMNGDTTRAGFALGAGAEWAVSGPWSIKAEYQYINLGTIGPISGAAVTPAGVPTGVLATTQSFRNDYHTVRVGLNYRF